MRSEDSAERVPIEMNIYGDGMRSYRFQEGLTARAGENIVVLDAGADAVIAENLDSGEWTVGELSP